MNLTQNINQVAGPPPPKGAGHTPINTTLFSPKLNSNSLAKFSKFSKHFSLKILTLALEVLQPKPPLNSSWAREAIGLDLRCYLFCRCNFVQEQGGRNLQPQIDAFIES